MCRLLAYSGRPRRFSELVIDPPHSLLEQSQNATEAKIATNGDGFGLAWYGDDPEPGRFRDVNPAWSDSNLPDLCRMVRANLFMAHVRASTSGATSHANCHPFCVGTMTFMHNGQLGDYPANRRRLEQDLPDDLYAQRAGTTDSELLFLHMLHNGLATDPASAIAKTLDRVATLKRTPAPDRLTCVFSDGHAVWGFRHASDARPPSLYLYQDAQGVILASEPLWHDMAGWSPVPQGTLITIAKDRSVARTALGFREFDAKHRACVA